MNILFCGVRVMGLGQFRLQGNLGVLYGGSPCITIVNQASCTICANIDSDLFLW